MIDVVVSIINVTRNVPAEARRLWSMRQYASQLNQLQVVERKSVHLLCVIEDLADRVNPHWRQTSADWQSLPYCGGSSTTTTPASTSVSNDPSVLMMANRLIDVLRMLKVARCIVQAQLNWVPIDTFIRHSGGDLSSQSLDWYKLPSPLYQSLGWY